MSEIIFGTDGWRALLDSEMNHNSVSIVAQAFADYLNSKQEKSTSVVIGYDGRKYSEEFARLFSEITTSNGITTYLSDRIIPTPVVSYYVLSNKLTAGVMITASHNPPEYNGVKFKDGYGGPFFTEKTHDIEKLLNKNSIKTGNKNFKEIDILTPYSDHISKIVDLKKISTSGLNVVIDSMGGAGGNIIELLLKNSTGKIKTIFSTPDMSFNGRLAEPIEKNLLPLRIELERGNYSIGIATDGDADRLGVMLETGEWLSAQETILLIADYLVNIKKLEGSIVKTSSVTDKLKAYFESDNRKVYDVQVGFKYICEKMIENEVLFGCEESGGFGYSFNMPERDGVFSGLLVCEMLAESGFNKLSEYVRHKRKKYGEIYYKRIDHHYFNEDRMDKLPELSYRKDYNFGQFSFVQKTEFFSSRGVVNGLKIKFDGKSNWLLIRSSETEPMFRIYAEGDSSCEVDDLMDYGINLLKI